MGWTDKEIFSNPNISEPRKVLAVYEYYIEGLTKKIRARISQDVNPPHSDVPFHFETNYYMHTPKQAGPYITSRPWESSAEAALHRAVDGLVSYFEEAVRAGHTPDDSWLVRNDDF